jgi:hypothetical protein
MVTDISGVFVSSSTFEQSTLNFETVEEYYLTFEEMTDMCRNVGSQLRIYAAHHPRQEKVLIHCSRTLLNAQFQYRFGSLCVKPAVVALAF